MRTIKIALMAVLMGWAALGCFPGGAGSALAAGSRPSLNTDDASAAQLTRQMLIDQWLDAAKAIPTESYVSRAQDYSESNSEADSSLETQTEEKVLEGLIRPEVSANRIDLDFADVTLNDIFLVIGKTSGINVMLDPDVKKLPADIHLKQVSLKEALVLLGNAYSLGYKRVENSLYVTSKEKVRQQTQSSKVIRLRNIKAANAKAMVKDLIKNVNISEDINTLIITGQPDEIEKVEGLIRDIDRAQPQVVLEARIIEVNKDALRDLGVDWSDQLSINYQESGRSSGVAEIVDPSHGLLHIGSFERNPLMFTSIIKMLETQNKAKVLSNPRVTTMNEKEAEIFVGDRVPYTVNTVAGGVTTTEVRFEEPGIRLKITPSIIDGEFVVIKVEPEVSFIFSFRGPDNQYPWIKKRNATAYVRVRNNEPFVLGGLLNQEDKKNLFKVPLLGGLPLIGNLFTHESHTLQDTELIITITPKVVQDRAGQ